MKRSKTQALAALTAILPAAMLTLGRCAPGGLFGLSAEFWKGAMIGFCITLQLAAIAYLVRTARSRGDDPTEGRSDAAVEKSRGDLRRE